MVHRREVDGEVLVFGNQGALWGNATTWWDHETGTVWSRPLGEAIVGPREGEKLELVASQVTSWGTWKQDHPDTLALDAPANSSRFVLSEMTIVVDFAEEVGVYPGASDRWNVFHRNLGDRTLTLVASEGLLVDEETGTVWDPASGKSRGGATPGRDPRHPPRFHLLRIGCENLLARRHLLGGLMGEWAT